MDTILYNGNIYLERERFAQALLIREGKIAQVGGNEEILAAAPEAEKIDAQGHTVVPGFVDSHQHLYHVGQNLLRVNLSQCASLQDVVDAGRKFIQENQIPEGQTVEGWGWNQDYFAEKGQMPTRHILDQVSQKHPLLFTRACGHVSVCNTLALQKAGVWDDVPQVEGGQLELEPDGRPNGILLESSAKKIVESAIAPPMGAAQMEQALEAAMKYASSKGLTSVQTNDVSGPDYDVILGVYDKLLHQKQSLRVYMQCCLMDLALFEKFLSEGHCTGKGDQWLKIGPLKLFTDGSLGGRTALMRQDYADQPGTRGISTLSQQDLDKLVQTAEQNGMQVAIHAIGDKAIEMCLDSYEKALEGRPNQNRHGIVHCQITDRPLLERFQKLNIHALVQPIFLHYDLHICADRVGEALAQTSYAFHTMNQLGLHVSYGTDSPVEDLDPIANLHCAVNRQDLKLQPAGGWNPAEKVDIYQAVDDYTIGGAYNAFEEGEKGRLAPGYAADLVILDQDIFHIPSEKILDTQVLATMVGGKMVYQK